MKNWQDFGFQIENTMDGSPTLRLLNGTHEGGESMHHSHGALSETEMIYGRAIKMTFEEVSSPQFLVVGLGLGYIEIIIAREALLRKCDSYNIYSFESSSVLKENFTQWIYNNKSTELNGINDVYDLITKLSIEDTSMSISSIKYELTKQFPKNYFNDLNLNFVENLPEILKSNVHCFLYDAFSSKTNPELWDEHFLSRFIHKTKDKKYSLLSTYAAKGTLKRALLKNNFKILSDAGFSGKRNSTLAIFQ